MKITSEKLLIICGKMPVARWVRMKSSGQWLLNNGLLLADAPKAHAKSPHQQAQNHRAQLKNQPPLKARSNFRLKYKKTPPALRSGVFFIFVFLL